MSVDGVEVGTGASANFGSRAVEMDALSLANIESVEVNKTLTADMDANAPAGTINMRSKNAFDRRGRVIAYQLALTANSHNLALGKTPGPREETSTKIRPSWKFDFSDVFLSGRLGLQLTLSDLTRNTPREFVATSYNYGNATRGPIITNLGFSSNSVLARTTTAGLNVDLKASSHLTLSFRSSYSSRLAPSTNRTWNLTASVGDILPESTLTRIVTRPNAANTRLQEGAALNNNKYTETLTLSPRFQYRHGALTLAGGMDYSLASAEYKDVSDGFFSVATVRLSSMSWMAERSGPAATDWKVTQLSGRPWSDPRSFNVDSAVANNIGSRQRRGENTSTTGYVNGTFQFGGPLPIQIKLGAKTRDRGYKIVSGGPQNWTYLGTATSQNAAGAALPTETIFRYGYDGDLNSAPVAHNWPYPDRTALAQLFATRPEYFRPNTVANFEQQFFFPQSVKEQIDSRYIAATGRWRQIRFETGLRYELTRTKARILESLPPATIRAQRPELVPGTIPYITYQYHNGERSTRLGEYDNLFWNGSVKYSIRRNLVALLSFSDAIRRPSYNNLAGRETVDEDDLTVTVPNPGLRPEESRKYYTSLQYYIEPAGTLSIGAFVLDVSNILESRSTLTQEEAGYADRTEYNGYTFLAFRNGTGTVRNRGLDFEYSQQLVFLPGALNGMSVFASMTRLIADKARVNVVNKAASGGIAFRYKRFTGRLNANWQAPKIRSLSAANTSYQDERTVMDGDVSYRFSDRYTLFVSAKNITDADSTIYDVNRAYGQKLNTQVAKYGTSWTVGVKGAF